MINDLHFITMNVKAVSNEVNLALNDATHKIEALANRAELEERRAKRFETTLKKVKEDLLAIHATRNDPYHEEIDDILEDIEECLYS